jgi:dTDP-4-dehydrorhamnose reductase
MNTEATGQAVATVDSICALFREHIEVDPRTRLEPFLDRVAQESRQSLLSRLVEMIELSITKKPIGTFNLGSRFGMSKATFAFKFAQALALDETCLTPMDSVEATFLKTTRPKDMRMNSSKFELSMGVVLPSLAHEIECVARSYRAEA